MNLVTNEASGLFLIPLGIKLNEQVWTLLSGLGLIFIPFAVLFIMVFFESRAQGADEGSPAVLAIKMVEKGFWTIALLLYFCVIPLKSTPNVEYRQYSCLNQPSIAMSSTTSATTASATALSAMGLSNTVSPPFIFGAVHTISTGINEALTSTLTCKKGASATEVNQVITNLIPETEMVYRSIREFNKQCYVVARNNIEEAMSQGKNLTYYSSSSSTSDTKYQWSFYPPDTTSQLMLNAYNGIIYTGDNYDRLTIEPSKYWFKSSQKGIETDCAVAAKDLYEKIESDFSSSETHQDSVKTVFNFTSLFNPGLTQALVKHDLIIAIYESALKHSGSSQTKWQSGSNSEYSNSVPSIMTMLEEYSKGESGQTFSNALSTTLVALGSMLTDVQESAKSVSATLIIPLMVVVFQLLLCAFLPLLIVISGFKPQVVYSWILLYFAVTLVPFWTNFGVQMETLLLSLASYNETVWSTNLNGSNPTGPLIHVLGTAASMFVYIIPMTWVVLVQIVGNIGASALVNAMSGSTDPGQTGTQLMADSAGATAKIAGGKAAKAYKSWKNEQSKKAGSGGSGDDWDFM